MNFIKSPLVRISFGLVMVTISVLLVSDLLGVMPDTKRAELNSRKIIVESLAVQFSTAITNNQIQSIQDTLKLLVERNDEMLSAGVRRVQGDLLAEYGGHSQHWTLAPGDNSTPVEMKVSLFDNQDKWGTVEIRFAELSQNSEMFTGNGSFLFVIGLVSSLCFVGYLVFLKRTMRELDPSAVIPERVRLALDTLSEGLLIVDQHSVIVFSNAAFARKTGLTSDDLVGRPSSSLPWEIDEDNSDYGELPWDHILEGGEFAAGDTVTVKLSSGLDKVFKFTLNASSIMTAEGEVRGALITFDDVTEVERQNEELQRTLGKLEKSQIEITRQNQELHVLATRDPLTGLLNRRSFFDSFETMITDAQRADEPLACIVVDIDHFKIVNDTFGHSVGDIVIKLLATVLTDCSRPNDIVGRFGGEEFCIALPGADREAAFGIAERMRCVIRDTNIAEFNNTHSITISSGITDLTQGARNVAEMFDQSDKALYFAKENGRNLATCWPIDEETARVAEPDSIPKTETETTVPAGNAGPPQALPVVTDQVSNPVVREVVTPEAMPTEQSPQVETLPSAQPQKSNINRSLLIDRINQAILRSVRYKTTIAVLAIEFDVMQRVNEAMGFSVGEKLEKAVTQRLKEALRRTDTVSISGEDELLFSVLHTGGREIVLLLTDLQDTDVVRVIMKRIFSATSEPVEVDGMELYLDADIGVSIYPLDSEDGDALLSQANSAMREAKKVVGSNNWQFYSADVNQTSQRKLRLEADLHVALEHGELVANYQPKVCLRTGAIIGMEALLRWKHPQLGMVPPDEFIALAEQSDLIDKITSRVITTACRQIKTWEEAGYGIVPIAVNLSPVQFRNDQLADKIISLVSDHDIPLESLELEITETVVVQNMQTAIDILEKLSSAGFCIAIDDFGVGYSSFSYLKKFPLNKVKIDKSFISDLGKGPTDAAIISAMIAMAHSLGLSVVAEGVETEEELRFLQDLRCDQVQGYLLSRPQPPEEISKLLSQSSGIKSMILNHSQASENSTSQHGGASMFGIINEFSAVNVASLKLVTPSSENKNV